MTKINKSKMHKIKFVIGDWSDDGHGMTKIYIYGCSHSGDDIETAYQKAVQTLGIDIKKSVAVEYEEPYLYEKEYKVIKTLGYDLGEYVDEEIEHNGKIYVEEPSDLVDMYMTLVKTELPHLVYELVNDGAYTIRGMGYGLFRS